MSILAALEHTDRICGFDMYLVVRRQLENTLAALTHLYLRPEDVTITPNSFLSGSAPRLRIIYLDGISFPGLPKLAIGLSSLTRLERLGCNSDRFDRAPTRNADLHLHRHAPSCPFSRTLSSLGAVNIWRISWPGIDAPLLNILDINFFFHQFAFDTSQLARLLVVHQSSRHSMKHACPFLKRAFWITLRLRQLEANGGRLELGMSCEESDRLLPSPGTALQLVLCSCSGSHRGTSS